MGSTGNTPRAGDINTRGEPTNSATLGRLPLNQGWRPTTTIQPEADATLRRVFGHALSTRTIRAMAGAPPNAQVEVEVRAFGSRPVFEQRNGVMQARVKPNGDLVYSPPQGYYVNWHIKGPMLPPGQQSADEGSVLTGGRAYTMGRSLVIDAPSGPHGRVQVAPQGMKNAHFYLAKSQQGRGTGAASFTAQVQTLARLGVPQIQTNAGRDKDTNGYKTWPDFGYNGPLRPVTLEQMGRIARGEAPSGGLKRATVERLTRMQARGITPQIRDLIATPDGHAWWEKHGIGMDLSFNLAKHSQDRAWLAHYLRGARGRGKTVPNPAHWR